jgi:hypothetical protein
MENLCSVFYGVALRIGTEAERSGRKEGLTTQHRQALTTWAEGVPGRMERSETYTF